jgi:hypothetical protein
MRSFDVPAALGLAVLLAAGCGKDPPRDDKPVSVAASASARSGAPAPMRVALADVQADPTIDSQQIRGVIRDEETGLLRCVGNKAETGAIALSFPIEADGTVGNIVEGSKTTYHNEDARVCVERLVGRMRFPSTAGSRSEVAITLEIRPRRAGE